MSDSIEALDISQLDDFSKELLKLATKTKPTETRKFLQTEGNKFRKEIVKTAKSRVKERTGNYIKGIKRGKVYKWQRDATAVRVYHRNGKGQRLKNGDMPAPHAHLIEFGHRIVDKNGNEKGFKKGKNVYRDASKNYEKEFLRNCETFIDDVIEKGLHL